MAETPRRVPWKPVLAALAAAAVLAAAVWAVFFSSWLAVARVDVRGTDVLGEEEVREAAAVPAGEPLATVDLGGVEARVEALAPVRDALVSREWPDRVLVEVEERVAVAVVELGGRLRGMDADGVVFVDYRGEAPDLPRVRTAADTSADALREAALVVAALPGSVVASVDHVEVETVDSISLALSDGRTVRWGSAERSEDKAEVLDRLLEQDARVYDVSVPGHPTTS